MTQASPAHEALVRAISIQLLAKYATRVSKLPASYSPQQVAVYLLQQANEIRKAGQ